MGYLQGLVAAASWLPLLAVAWLFGTGCTTLTVPPLKAAAPESLRHVEEKQGLLVGAESLSDPKAVQSLFLVNLLELGILPIRIAAHNRHPTASFVLLLDHISAPKAGILSREPINRWAADRERQGNALIGAGWATFLFLWPVAVPLVISGANINSDATVVRLGAAQKEFQTDTLAPGQQTSGFVFLSRADRGTPSSDIAIQIEALQVPDGIPVKFELFVSSKGSR